jgi:hypothetical protein
MVPSTVQAPATTWCLGSGADASDCYVYSMILIWPLGSGAQWDKALSVPHRTALMFQQLDVVILLDNTLMFSTSTTHSLLKGPRSYKTAITSSWLVLHTVSNLDSLAPMLGGWTRPGTQRAFSGSLKLSRSEAGRCKTTRKIRRRTRFKRLVRIYLGKIIV